MGGVVSRCCCQRRHQSLDDKEPNHNNHQQSSNGSHNWPAAQNGTSSSGEAGLLAATSTPCSSRHQTGPEEGESGQLDTSGNLAQQPESSGGGDDDKKPKPTSRFGSLKANIKGTYFETLHLEKSG